MLTSVAKAGGCAATLFAFCTVGVVGGGGTCGVGKGDDAAKVVGVEPVFVSGGVVVNNDGFIDTIAMYIAFL